MENNNIRTMEYLGEDSFNCPVYKCIETDTLYKDINLGNGNPYLHSCNNDFDGEPNQPINADLEIRFIKSPDEPTQEEKFNYMMLNRLQMDCNYYLGYGNRYAKHLWAGDEKEQIKEMKKLYNSFSDDKKPEWLTMEQILDYENLMING